MTSISIWMNKQNGSNYRETFTNQVARAHDCLAVSATLIDNNKPISNDNVVFDLNTQSG